VLPGSICTQNEQRQGVKTLHAAQQEKNPEHESLGFFATKKWGALGSPFF